LHLTVLERRFGKDLLGPAAWRAGRADHAPRQAGLRMEATPGCPVTN